eukprot:4198820-Prymnesium_polylepis.1
MFSKSKTTPAATERRLASACTAAERGRGSSAAAQAQRALRGARVAAASHGGRGRWRQRPGADGGLWEAFGFERVCCRMPRSARDRRPRSRSLLAPGRHEPLLTRARPRRSERAGAEGTHPTGVGARAAHRARTRRGTPCARRLTARGGSTRWVSRGSVGVTWQQAREWAGRARASHGGVPGAATRAKSVVRVWLRTMQACGARIARACAARAPRTHRAASGTRWPPT